jgi:hypothetical protein
MAQRYADEVRRDRKDADRCLKDLVNKRVQKEKERIEKASLLDEIETIGQRGTSIDPVRLRSNIAQLKKEILELGVEIDKQRMVYHAFKDELDTAPRRPKTRTPAASIAASGSRAINDKARQFDRQSLWTTWKGGADRGTPETMLWSAGKAAARKTAKDRYDLDTLPPESEAIMKRTMDKALQKRKIASRSK